MNAKVIWAVLAILIIGAIGWYAFSAERAVAPTEADAAANTEPAPAEETSGDEPFAALITYTDDGFSPASVTVNRGETVRFVNQSARGMWVGSDDHPTHTQYDGTSTREHCADGTNTTGTFDQCRAAATGESWEYAFEKSGTFGFHNHMGASNTGTVIVQ